MIPGIDTFREKFSEYLDCYTIIGGTACDILLSEENLSFRLNYSFKHAVFL